MIPRVPRMLWRERMAWTKADQTRWRDEYDRMNRLTEAQSGMVEWLSRRGFTHTYHQTFRAEITDASHALAIGRSFLAGHASILMLKDALLVAERHPNRKSTTRSAPLQTSIPQGRADKYDDWTTKSRHARTQASRHLSYSQTFVGQQGRLYHLHGLLTTRYETARSSLGNSVISFWRLLSDLAFSRVGIARAWPLEVGLEVAATIYAVKYMLKGMKEWPESCPTLPDRLPWEIPAPHDDWTILTF